MKITPFFHSQRTIWLLPLLALCYYGYYYRCGLYPCGEGGVEGVTALRLLSGKIPITEVALNYNLLWFYPIVGLFKIFGPSYTAIKIFFFSLCTITSLLAYSILFQTTRRPWLALLAGIVTLLLPGQIFRNYMAFIVVLNMALFLKAFLLPCYNKKNRLLWIFFAGLCLGIAFLIRIDLGFFLSAVLLGIIFLSPFCWKKEERYHYCKQIFASIFLIIAGIMITHWPLYHDATRRGFDTPFLKQYEAWPKMILSQGSSLLSQTWKHLLPLTSPGEITTVAPTKSKKGTSIASTPTIEYRTSNNQSPLARRSFASADIREQLMALNLYLPLWCSSLLILLVVIFFLLGIKKSDPILKQRGAIILTCLGCTLTLFPQYFFWRPDMIHLSEFMVPMNITLLITMAFAYEAWKSSRLLMRTLVFVFFLIAALTFLLYFIAGIQSQSTGGIAISEHRTVPFHGNNGVDVLLTPNEFEETEAIYLSIVAHADPNDSVICFPYNPEINFMTDRLSYRHNLYTDDMTASKNFDRDTISEIEKNQPAVIVINNWPINGTEHSRFKNWATETYYYIRSHYLLDYKKGILEVFVRPDKEGKKK